jgi:NAD(P)H-dependent flavin oxidoreductase YrpB (nitropropane dioxygenase family)
VRAWADITLEEKVPVMVAGLGNPGPVTAQAHRQGMKVMALCGNVKQALDHAANGVDVVIAQGHEAGGHTGRIAGLVLIPSVVDTLAPRPVLAAGGMADGRGIAAALALGAQGVWMGTRFIATPEAYCHDNYKQRVVTLDAEGTVGDARRLRQAVPADPQQLHAGVGEARSGDPAVPGAGGTGGPRRGNPRPGEGRRGQPATPLADNRRA